MTNLQLELSRLIGKKDLSFGCLLTWGTIIDDKQSVIYPNGGTTDTFPEINEEEIIGHPATLGDLHRMLASLGLKFDGRNVGRYLHTCEECGSDYAYDEVSHIDYDFTKDLLDQSEEILNAITNLINSHS